MFVALKEITLQEEEGIPFTAIREGKKHSKQEFTQKNMKSILREGLHSQSLLITEFFHA